MTMHDNTILMDRLRAALEPVNASLIDTSNHTGRDYHKRAIDALTTITAQLDAIMRAERSMEAATAGADATAVDAAIQALHEATLRYEQGEYFTKAVNLGDHIVIDHGTNEFKISPFGSWMPIYDNMPITTRIADRQMERLYAILEAVEAGTGIQITAHHVSFRPSHRYE